MPLSTPSGIPFFLSPGALHAKVGGENRARRMAPHVDALRIASVLLDMLMNPGYRGGDIFGLRRILESVDGEPIASYGRDDAVGGKWPCDVSVMGAVPFAHTAPVQEQERGSGLRLFLGQIKIQLLLGIVPEGQVQVMGKLLAGRRRARIDLVVECNLVEGQELLRVLVRVVFRPVLRRRNGCE